MTTPTPSQLLLARNAGNNSSYASAEPAFVSASARPYSGTVTGKAGQRVTLAPPSDSAERTTPALKVHQTFADSADNPGTVLCEVEGIKFYCHRDILMFGSLFFECLLQGGWRETQSETSTWPGDKRLILEEGNPVSLLENDRPTTPTRDSIPLPSPLPLRRGSVERAPSFEGDENSREDTFSDHETSDRKHARNTSTSQMQPRDDRDAGQHRLTLQQRDAEDNWTVASSSRKSFVQQMEDFGVHVISEEAEEEVSEADLSKNYEATAKKKIDAHIHLREEKASAFQDLLFFIYPHLELQVNWSNAYDLMTMARKFDMPFLTRHCVDFLLASAAGKPINALKIAEDFALPDLYKEASRYVLDQFTQFEPTELDILTGKTLLKLEKRRTFFLERLLKLGLVNQSRDYTCCPSCPDPQQCARLLEEKWRSAWNSAFRFGPAPQPSIIYRCLRQLEPSSSSALCQATAKTWVAGLFDRMFSIGSASVHSTFSRTFRQAAFDSFSSRQQKYFLFIELADAPPPGRKHAV